MREQSLEVAVDGRESFIEPRLALAIELLNRDPELGDALLQIVTFGDQAFELLRDFDQIVVRLKVDAAEALTVGLEPRQMPFDIGKRRNGGCFGKRRDREAVLRRDFEGFANMPCRFLAPLARILKARLDAGIGLPRRRYLSLDRSAKIQSRPEWRFPRKPDVSAAARRSSSARDSAESNASRWAAMRAGRSAVAAISSRASLRRTSSV